MSVDTSGMGLLNKRSGDLGIEGSAASPWATLQAFHAAIELADRALAGHCIAVAIYARDLAGELGLSESDQQLAYLSGLVHDVGKIGLASELIWNHAQLSLEQRRELQQYPARGEGALQSANCDEISEIVRHQAEQFDGEGYPDGLAREQIPLLSRVIAVADAYNLLTMQQPWRSELSPDAALQQLTEEAGARFDPEIVAAFARLIARSEAGYRTTGPEFVEILRVVELPLDEW